MVLEENRNRLLVRPSAAAQRKGEPSYLIYDFFVMCGGWCLGALNLGISRLRCRKLSKNIFQASPCSLQTGNI